MKYIIYAGILVIGMATGVAGGTYITMADFEAMSGVSWVDFTEGSDNCESEAQEPCRIYGGFAPSSQFEQ